MVLSLSEKIITLGGEAPIGGEPVYLIRFSGCNLSCTYCDTPERDAVSLSYTENDLRDDIERTTAGYPALRVLFTGGEPLLDERQRALLEIVARLPSIRFYIETNGSIGITGTSLPNCHYICDIKTPSSGSGGSFFPPNLEKLRPEEDCIKFVADEGDLPWIKERLAEIERINPALPVYLSPVWGKTTPAVLAGFILENKLRASLSLQVHKIIWENFRGR
ncbi:MAG: radical SAM protein [Spirochaetales bacterium]|nr:radical SAM protein [Spirochaetales bacterium]